MYTGCSQLTKSRPEKFYLFKTQPKSLQLGGVAYNARYAKQIR